MLATFAYDDLGRRDSLTRGNGTVTDYAYDAASRLATLTQDLPGTASDLTLGFTHNPAGQIATAARSNDGYAFTGYVNAVRTETPNALNQLASVNGAARSYDARGNLTADGSRTFTYSLENMLNGPSGGLTLNYDPLLRLSQVSGAATARFGYDGVDLIAEYDGSDQLIRRHVHGPGADEPLVTYEGSGTSNRRFLHADERGSIVAATDGAGAPLAINRYDEYGAPHGGNSGRFQYTGQAWLPELGLYYYKARMYDPVAGRFLQADPIGYDDGMNMYAYVGGDPVNFVDPSGLNGCGKSDLEPIQICGRKPKDDHGANGGIAWAGNGGPGGGGGGGGRSKKVKPPQPSKKQCQAEDGSIRNDNPGKLPAGNVVHVGISLEGYLGPGLGGQIGIFYDKSTGNFGLFRSFEGGAGLGMSGGIQAGATQNLSSFQGGYRVTGAGAGPISGNVMQSKDRSVIGYSAGAGFNLGPKVPVSGHSSRGYTQIGLSTLPRCLKK